VQARKEQFQGIRTRWEKEQIKKQLMREELMAAREWVKPRAQPIQIGNIEERQKALKQGNMVFRDGDVVIELPLLLASRCEKGDFRALQGVYKIPGKGYVVARTWPKSRWGPDQLELFRLEKFKTVRMEQVGNEWPKTIPVEYWVEKDMGGQSQVSSFFYRTDDLGHMAIADSGYQGHGLALKMSSKTEREQRARQPSGHPHRFVGLRRLDTSPRRRMRPARGSVQGSDLHRRVRRSSAGSSRGGSISLSMT